MRLSLTLLRSIRAIVPALLLRELPYRNPDEIVTIWLTNREHPEERVRRGAWREVSRPIR